MAAIVGASGQAMAPVPPLQNDAVLVKDSAGMGAHVTDIRVRWEDADLAGVVYFANYFKYFERAETEFLRALGMSENEMLANEGVILPRVEAFCHYRVPCYYDELLQVKTQIKELTSRSVSFGFEIYKSGNNRLAAAGRLKCICSRAGDGMKSIRFPEAVYETFKRGLT